MSILLSSAYFPPIHYFTKLYAHSNVWIEQEDNYVKQTYRNRCMIGAADGPLTLTIPVEKGEGGKSTMKDIRISDHGRWQHLHWQALVSAYRTSPFFEYYMDDFRPFFDQKWSFLMDLNEAITLKCCELIDIQPSLQRTEIYQKQEEVEIPDFRELIHPKRDYNLDDSFSPIPYYQIFSSRHGFMPNLSVADLLFNMGPESLLVLRDSITK